MHLSFLLTLISKPNPCNRWNDLSNHNFNVGTAMEPVSNRKSTEWVYQEKYKVFMVWRRKVDEVNVEVDEVNVDSIVDQDG